MIAMHNDDTPAEVGPLSRLSLHKLAEFAMKEKLIEDLESFENRVIITQGENRFVLPPKQASTFLIGMLRGRSWFIDDEVPSMFGGTPVSKGSEESEGPDASELRTLDATLDSILAFTQDVGIINGYQKDDVSRSVRIDISACSTNLSYVDALGYLFDCVQHEMRSLKERSEPGRSPSF